MKQNSAILAIVFGLGMLAGCHSNRTETGYEPRHLGMNSNSLRSLYAPAFSPEAQAAENERRDQLQQMRRPNY